MAGGEKYLNFYDPGGVCRFSVQLKDGKNPDVLGKSCCQVSGNVDSYEKDERPWGPLVKI
ncbi:MAG TPA: hypothetical protein PKA31_00630 [Candidatus Moranbacteria bacterium]|nr:hypothetical protein [Candidatus Moranbacteria bacterium]